MVEFKQLVGDQIRSIRKLRGMTQELLAEQSGLSYSYISDVERGTRNISLESLGKIIGALGIKPAELFEIADGNTRHPDADEIQNKIRTLNTLIADRSLNEVNFLLTMAREFLNAMDRKGR